MRVAVVIFFAAHFIQRATFKTSTTLSQKIRIKLLKQQLNYEIRALRNNSRLYPDNEQDLLEYYADYENENLPLTPIILNERKSRANVNSVTVKMSSVTFDTPSVKPEPGKDNTPVSLLRENRKIKQKKHKLRVKKPIEIFYRRMYNKDILSQCLQWVHCQEMVTPLLTGVKRNASGMNLINSKDPTIMRLFQLLRVNTSAYSRDDVYSILYQISNLKLRLFQWDVQSLTTLLNIIIKDKIHTFLNLKHGISELFKRWRLDFSSTTTLLKQTRIIRPPCIYIADADGSTKSPKISKYTRPQTSKLPGCDDYDNCR